MRGPRSVRIIFGLAVGSGLLAPVAFSLQRADHMSALWYFSNLASIVLFVAGVLWFAGVSDRATSLVVELAATTTALSSVIFFTVIAPHNGYAVWSDVWSVVDNTALHVTSPAIAISCLVVWKTRVRRSLMQTLGWVTTFPIAYLVVVLVAYRAGLIPEVPYEFLSVEEFGAERVALFVVALLAIYLAIGTAIYRLTRLRRSKGDPTVA